MDRAVSMSKSLVDETDQLLGKGWEFPMESLRFVRYVCGCLSDDTEDDRATVR